MYAVIARTKTDDVNEAQALMQELFYYGNLSERMREAEQTLRRWTRARVVALFGGHAARVDGFELDTLRDMKRQKLMRELNDARRGHAEFIDETERLAEMFAPDAEDQSRDAVALRRTLARGMGLSRNEGRDE